MAIDRVTRRIGGLVALNAVSFDVAEGEILGIIGPNGAGKTTLFDVITAFAPLDEGAIHFAGRRLDGLRSDEICRAGVGRTFQHAQPFLDLTVLENVMIGAFSRHPDRRGALAKALSSLASLGLEHRAGALGRSLQPAELKKLEIARALATEPRLLLLDECMAGLRPREVEHLVSCVKKLNARGVTFVIIEHVIGAMRALADRVVMLHHGEKFAEGAVEDVFNAPHVIDAYLGAAELDA